MTHKWTETPMMDQPRRKIQVRSKMDLDTPDIEDGKSTLGWLKAGNIHTRVGSKLGSKAPWLDQPDNSTAKLVKDGQRFHQSGKGTKEWVKAGQ